jgi:hypothetical protein
VRENEAVWTEAWTHRRAERATGKSDCRTSTRYFIDLPVRVHAGTRVPLAARRTFIDLNSSGDLDLLHACCRIGRNRSECHCGDTHREYRFDSLHIPAPLGMDSVFLRLKANRARRAKHSLSLTGGANRCDRDVAVPSVGRASCSSMRMCARRSRLASRDSMATPPDHAPLRSQPVARVLCGKALIERLARLPEGRNRSVGRRVRIQAGEGGRQQRQHDLVRKIDVSGIGKVLVRTIETAP